MRFRRLGIRLKIGMGLAFALLTGAAAFAQEYDQKFLSEMHWRGIGPFRGGRTRAAAGVPSQPNVFYIGVCNGGVWKSDDYGLTWAPIFDQQPTGSIRAGGCGPSTYQIVCFVGGEVS